MESGDRDFSKGEYQIEILDDYLLITKEYGDITLFQEAIKNKSELKRLLKQLGI